MIWNNKCKHDWIETSIHPMYSDKEEKLKGVYLGTVRKCKICKKLEKYYIFDSSISINVFRGFKNCNKIEEEFINKYADFENTDK